MFNLTNKPIPRFRKILIFAVLFCIQLLLIGTLEYRDIPGGDEIFTYTLANTPYSYDYIDSQWQHWPNENGWVDDSILQSNYTVQDYDRFDYSSVYWHQRIDNHPILYYSLVHTVCSLLPSGFAPNAAELINFFFVIGIDLLLLLIFRYITGNVMYAVLPVVFSTLLVIFQNLASLQRMYCTLAFMTLWYLWLHIRLLTLPSWKRRHLAEMVLVVLLGSLTHYYFYVFATGVSLITAGCLIYRRYWRSLICYIGAGITGMAISLIIFPWMIWHILFNQMQKHTSLDPWNLSKVFRYLQAINERLLNGHWIIALLLLVLCLGVYILHRRVPKIANITLKLCDTPTQMPVLSRRIFWILLAGSELFYSLLIFTLDDNNWYYMTCFYLPAVVLITALLVTAFRGLRGSLRCAVSFLLIVCTLGITPTLRNLQDNLAAYRTYTAFHQITEKYSSCDCLYVEATETNLLSDILFDLGEYDEIKRITLSDYTAGGITEDMLSGREPDSSGKVIVYLPSDATITSDYSMTLLGSFNGMSCYLLSYT